jgi:hypothetical protein
MSESREIRAPGPRADPEGARTAYLELLKLALCDLVGESTEGVYKRHDGRTYSRQLSDEDLRYRVTGMDWPLRALTMVGLARLDDLQRCVESVVEDGIEGDMIEAGAWRGGASILIRATLDTLGDERVLWVADSFAGFPDSGSEDADLDLEEYGFLVAPLDRVRRSFARLGLERGVEFVPGFFADTLPDLRAKRWSLVRLDSDTYESTKLALESLYPGLSAGGYLIADDYKFIPECRRAVDEFRAEHDIAAPLEEVDWNAVRWRRENEPEASATEDAPQAAEPHLAARLERAVVPQRPARIPTERELELERQLAELRGRR